MQPERGEIYLVQLPSQPEDHKSRPALIVSMNTRNRLANDVIVIPLSSILRDAPTHVFVPKGEGGLHQDSMAKCEQITTLHKSFLIRGPFAGKVRDKTLKAIELAILRAIDIPI